MTAVHKHTLSHGDNHMPLFPSSCRVFSCGEQAGQIVIWEIHEEEDTALVEKLFKVVMTGEPFEIKTGVGIIGTVQMKSGLVFHIFEVFPSN